MEIKQNFDVIDYLVFCSVILITILIGFYHGYKNQILQILNSKIYKNEMLYFLKKSENNQNKTLEYLNGNSNMSVFPISMSLLGTCFSATALVGIPTETYQYGIQSWTGVFGIMLAPLFGAYITGPMFEKLKILSVFEYFKLRYDSDLIQFVAVFCYLIRNFLAISIFIYGPAASLSSIIKINDWLAILLIGSIATLYTAIGGLKGVIWTDVFQTFIMFIGLIFVIVKGVIDVDGLKNVWLINEKGGRLNFFIFNLNPFIRQSNWSNIFGSFIFFSISYGVDQQMIQRFMASKSKKKAQHAILLNIPGIFLLMSLCAFTGMVMYANFSTCDPLSIPSVSKLTNPNQLVPYFIKAKLGDIPGMVGLFLAAIISAALSTISSLLNSQSMIIWNSILKRFNYFKLLNDDQSLKINRIVILIIGIFCTCFSFIISRIGNNIFQVSLGLLGAFGTPIISLFVLSYFFKYSNVIGAFVGTFCGFVFVVWISIGSYLVKPIYPKLVTNISGCNFTNFTFERLDHNYSTFFGDSGESINVFGFNKIYTISFASIPLFGFMITIVIGLFSSLLTSNKISKSLNLIRS